MDLRPTADEASPQRPRAHEEICGGDAKPHASAAWALPVFALNVLPKDLFRKKCKNNLWELVYNFTTTAVSTNWIESIDDFEANQTLAAEMSSYVFIGEKMHMVLFGKSLMVLVLRMHVHVQNMSFSAKAQPCRTCLAKGSMATCTWDSKICLGGNILYYYIILDNHKSHDSLHVVTIGSKL